MTDGTAQDGAPSWVETLQPDPRAAQDFYGPLLGWEFRELADGYLVAGAGGRDVAGIGSLPASGGAPGPALWSTCVRADVPRAVERATAAAGSLLLGPVDRLGGRWAALVDPTGAAVGVLDVGAPDGARAAPGAWVISLHTPDPVAAGAFYREVFGWEPESLAPGSPVTVFRVPGRPADVVAVMSPSGDGPVPPHWSVNLAVEDAEAVARRAGELGGRVLMPPTETPGFRSAVLLDPQGAVFSVSQVVAGD